MVIYFAFSRAYSRIHSKKQGEKFFYLVDIWDFIAIDCLNSFDAAKA